MVTHINFIVSYIIDNLGNYLATRLGDNNKLAKDVPAKKVMK